MIECPHCLTNYNVQVPETGQKMRCARCSEIWYAIPVPELLSDEAPNGAVWSGGNEEGPDSQVLAGHAPEPEAGFKTDAAQDGLPAAEYQEVTNSALPNPALPNPVLPEDFLSEPQIPAAAASDHGLLLEQPEGAPSAGYDTQPTDPQENQSPIDEPQWSASTAAPQLADMPPVQSHDVSGADDIAVSSAGFSNAPAQPGGAAHASAGYPYENTGSDSDFPPPVPGAVSYPAHGADSPNFAAVAAVGASSSDVSSEYISPVADQSAGGFSVQAGHRIRSNKTALAWVGLCSILSLIVFSAFYFRDGVVRALPGAASLYGQAGLEINVRGLTFKGVKYRWDRGSSGSILTIEGEIINVTEKALKVPPVLAELRDDKGFVFYRTNKIVRSEDLNSGERSYFMLKIKSPPRTSELADVRLHFRMDLL